MDLSSPLRSLAPSLDSAVLEVLAGTESALGISQIARVAGRGSRQGLTVVLDRLVDHGLVNALPANRGYLYRLNRDHVLADAVMSACRARVSIIARLAEAVQQLDPQPAHVSVFGSFARREAGPDSDIDVLLILPAGVEPSEDWYARVRDIGDRAYSWTGNRMESLAYTRDELRDIVDRGEPIVASWRADSVTVFGAPLDVVLDHAASGTERTAP